jgi:hypothetical protein
MAKFAARVSTVVVAVALSGAACGGGSTAKSTNSNTTTGFSVAGLGATTTTTAGAGASALPDPCTLLTPSEGEALIGGGQLTARAEASDSLTGNASNISRGCILATAPDNSEVEVIVADLHALFGGTTSSGALAGLRGNAVSGVGDAAKFFTASRAGLSATKGHWLVWIQADAIASSGAYGAARLPAFITAMNAALGRLPA